MSGLFDGVKKAIDAAKEQYVEQVEARQTQVTEKDIQLVLIDGYWYLVTPAGNDGKRKSLKLCKKLLPTEIINQDNNRLTVSYGLTKEAAAKLEALEEMGYQVKLPE